MKVLKRKFGKAPQKPTISIIVVAYKTGQELRECLESLSKQTCNDFEIIIVDNDFEDLNMLAKYTLDYYRLGKNYGLSYARNFGVERSQGSILAFLDDDAIPDAKWTESIFNTFKQKGIVAIRGKILPKSERKVYNYLATHYDLGGEPLLRSLDTEGNSAIRRDAYEAVGGFNPKLFIYMQEGLVISIALSKHGRIMYAPEMIIYHDFADSFLHYIRKQYSGSRNKGSQFYTNKSLQNFRKKYEDKPTVVKAPSIFSIKYWELFVVRVSGLIAAEIGKLP